MSESDSFKNLKDQYFLLDRNFNKAFDACTTDDERNRFKRDYVNSRDNFWEARNRIFLENDPLVTEISEDLKKSNDTINEMLSDLKDIPTILNTITAGVRLGSSLITLGSTGIAP